MMPILNCHSYITSIASESESDQHDLDQYDVMNPQNLANQTIQTTYNTIENHIKNINQNQTDIDDVRLLVILKIIYGTLKEISYVSIVFKTLPQQNIVYLSQKDLLLKISNSRIGESLKEICDITNYCIHDMNHIIKLHDYFNSVLFEIIAQQGVIDGNSIYIDGLYTYLLKLIPRFKLKIKALFKLRDAVIRFCRKSNPRQRKMNAFISVPKIPVPVNDYKMGLMIIMINSAISMLILQSNINNIPQISDEILAISWNIFEKLKQNLDIGGDLKKSGHINLRPSLNNELYSGFICINLNENLQSFAYRSQKLTAEQRTWALLINQQIYEICNSELNQIISQKQVINGKIDDKYDINQAKSLYMHNMDVYITKHYQNTDINNQKFNNEFHDLLDNQQCEQLFHNEQLIHNHQSSIYQDNQNHNIQRNILPQQDDICLASQLNTSKKNTKHMIIGLLLVITGVIFYFYSGLKIIICYDNA
jgi:hypothetical protein